MRQTPLVAVRRLTRAWIRKDQQEMSRWLAHGIVEVSPQFESPLIGMTDFFRKYQAYFCGEQKIEAYRILRPRTVQLSPRLALVYFQYTMRTRTGDVVRDSRGKESMVAEKTPRGWQISFLHWHEDPQA